MYRNARQARRARAPRKPGPLPLLAGKTEDMLVRIEARAARVASINHLPPKKRNEILQRWLAEDGLI